MVIDIYTYLYTYIHTCVHMNMHACIHTCIYTYIHTHMHTRKHTHSRYSDKHTKARHTCTNAYTRAHAHIAYAHAHFADTCLSVTLTDAHEHTRTRTHEHTRTRTHARTSCISSRSLPNWAVPRPADCLKSTPMLLQGSLPGFLNGTKGTLRAYATGAAKTNPRHSGPPGTYKRHAHSRAIDVSEC